MKPLRLALSSVAAMAALSGLPLMAHAQSAYDYGVDASANVSDRGAWRLSEHEDRVANALHDALKDHAIDTDQYRRLRNQLDAVKDAATRMRTRQDGVLTDVQVARLSDRLDVISSRLGSLSNSGYPY